MLDLGRYFPIVAGSVDPLTGAVTFQRIVLWQNVLPVLALALAAVAAVRFARR